MTTSAVHEAAPPPAPPAERQPADPGDPVALGVSLMHMLRDDLHRNHRTQVDLVHVLRDLHDVTRGLRDELTHMRRARGA